MSKSLELFMSRFVFAKLIAFFFNFFTGRSFVDAARPQPHVPLLQLLNAEYSNLTLKNVQQVRVMLDYIGWHTTHFPNARKTDWLTLTPLMPQAPLQWFKCSIAVLLNFDVAQRNICKRKTNRMQNCTTIFRIQIRLNVVVGGQSLKICAMLQIIPLDSDKVNSSFS